MDGLESNYLGSGSAGVRAAVRRRGVVGRRPGKNGGGGEASLGDVLKKSVLTASFFHHRAGLLMLVVVFVVFCVRGQCTDRRRRVRVSQLGGRLVSVGCSTLAHDSRLVRGDHRSHVRRCVSAGRDSLRASAGPPCRVGG